MFNTVIKTEAQNKIFFYKSKRVVQTMYVLIVTKYSICIVYYILF